jgi:transposase
MREYKKNGTHSFKGQGVPTTSNEEIVALKKQLVDLKMENDILKKAAAIFVSQKK